MCTTVDMLEGFFDSRALKIKEFDGLIKRSRNKKIANGVKKDLPIPVRKNYLMIKT
jgi:hypothetical protein